MQSVALSLKQNAGTQDNKARRRLGASPLHFDLLIVASFSLISIFKLLYIIIYNNI